jgi:hypothetical protein
MKDVYDMMQVMYKRLNEERDENSIFRDEIRRLREENDRLKEKEGATHIKTAVKNETPSVKKERNDEMVTPGPATEDRTKKAVTPAALFTSDDKQSSRSNKMKGTYQDDIGDEEIMESESDDEAHEYASYVEWLLKREKLYPYHDDKHHKKYQHRCTLLSHNGRVNEYYRFGYRVSFDKRLYPSGYDRWFRWYSEKLLRGSSNLRETDIRTLTVPAFYYDDREVRLRTRSNDDCDISPYAITLSGLPRELQDNPSMQSFFYTSPPSLTTTVDRYFYQYKLRVAAAPTNSQHVKIEPVSGSDSMINKSQHVSSYDSSFKNQLPVSSHSSSSSSSSFRRISTVNDSYNNNNNNSNADRGKMINSSVSPPTVKKEPISYPRDNYDNQSSGAGQSTPSTRVGFIPPELSEADEARYFGKPSPATLRPAASSSMDPSAEAYTRPESRIQQVKQEQDEYNARQDDSAHHVTMRERHVLGDVINLFDQGTRAILELTRSTRVMTPAEINKAVSTTANALQDFDGDPEKAPRWFLDLCMNVSRIDFSHSDVITIMNARMVKGAKAWFSAAVMKVSALHHDKREVIPALLGLFREQYMNNTHILSYRSRLNEMRMTDLYVLPNELRLHYSKFTALANNLKICDKYMTDDTIKQMFLESLPRSLRNYIGTSYKSCESVDAIYQLAEEACRSNAPKKKADLDNETVSLNSVDTAEYDDDDDRDEAIHEDDFLPEKDIQHVWFMAQNIKNKKTPLVKDDVSCWHCGYRGHYAGECEVNLQGLPQTPRGAQMFAAFNRMRGEVRVYDAKQQIDNSEKYRQRREKNHKVNNHPPNDVLNKKKDKRRIRRIRDDEDDVSIDDVPISSNKKKDVVEVQSHVIELNQEENDEDDDDDDTKKHIVRLSSIDSVKYKPSTLQQVKHREMKDAKTATSMCLPVEVNGVSMGYALGDQGATKTIMRASALDKLDVNVKEHGVKNHYVVCADGGEIPIRSRFNAIITSNGKSLGDTLIYVVDDTPEKDITCDMVIGRSTMAASKYNCIDTKKGTLFNKQTGDEIRCLPAQFVDIRSKRHIVPRSMYKTASNKIDDEDQ